MITWLRARFSPRRVSSRSSPTERQTWLRVSNIRSRMGVSDLSGMRISHLRIPAPVKGSLKAL